MEVSVFDCTTDRYDELYAPYLKDPGALLRLGSYDPRKRLFDLAGGTGAVSKAALRIAAEQGITPARSSIFLFDKNPRWDRHTEGHAVFPIQSAPDGLLCMGLMEHVRGSFDLVVCRQAMGYLDPAETIKAASILNPPGGRFVFNTFQRPRRFGWKMKTFEGIRFGEAHVFVFGRVFHLQARLGARPGLDFTHFRYHAEGRLQTLLEPLYDVQVHRQGRSLHWLCTRKAT